MLDPLKQVCNNIPTTTKENEMKNTLIMIVTVIGIIGFMAYLEYAAKLMEQATINANQ